MESFKLGWAELVSVAFGVYDNTSMILHFFLIIDTKTGS